MTKNIQINDMVKAMVESEPCLFNNSKENLMPVQVKIINETRQLELNERMYAIALWHGGLQAKFEIELFGHSLYKTPELV